jgi:hypothetical protein
MMQDAGCFRLAFHLYEWICLLSFCSQVFRRAFWLAVICLLSMNYSKAFFIRLLKAVFRIRIHFLRIRIQWIRMEANTDPDTDPDPIRIQGFNDQKLKKNNG